MRPAVLSPVIVTSPEDLGDAIVAAVAAAGAGATGIDLSFESADVAVAAGSAAADQIADTCNLDVYIRSDLPFADHDHTLIRSTPGHPGIDAVVDLQIDRLGLGPASDAVAESWPVGEGRACMISTLGFDDLSDAELMALATVATVRGSAAITTDRPGVVRRVVDTVSAVLAAGQVA